MAGTVSQYEINNNETKIKLLKIVTFISLLVFPFQDGFDGYNCYIKYLKYSETSKFIKPLIQYYNLLT
jgi:hypothetical protein